MSSSDVETRLAIRELCDTYSVAAMRKDVALWSSTWAEDCRWKLPVFDRAVMGKELVVEAFIKRLEDDVGVLSLVGFPVDLVVEGNSASGKFYCQEIIFSCSGASRRFILGCFHDDYVLRDGAWKFASRDYEVFGRA